MCWVSLHIAYQKLGYEHGWKKEIIPIPVMYEGTMVFELLWKMTCTYMGKKNVRETMYVTFKTLAAQKYMASELLGNIFTYMIDINSG